MNWIKEKEYGLFVEIDGPCGTTYVEADVFTDEQKQSVKAGGDKAVKAARDYYEGTDIWTVKFVKGMFTRESMPGCLDCTEWTPIKINSGTPKLDF